MIERITPGDILAVRGKSWTSNKIAKATKGQCSHVGLFICAGEEPLVIEASTRVVTRFLRDSLYDAKRAWVLHPLNLSREQRVAIIRNACQFSGRSYGHINLLSQYADILFRTNFFSTYLSFSRYPICSMVVGLAYAGEGLYFGGAPQSASPAEIFKYAKDNPDKYKLWELA